MSEPRHPKTISGCVDFRRDPLFALFDRALTREEIAEIEAWALANGLVDFYGVEIPNHIGRPVLPE